jgi:hypothetical protein
MNGLIYNQRDIPKDKWRYGLRSSAATGCGWIATHNALRLMGYQTNIDELIRYYTWQLPLIHGNAGTSFWGPALCFKTWKFPVEICTNRLKFDDVACRSDVCILFYHWHKGCKLGAHFIALQHTENGIVSYNTYRNSTGPDHLGPSLTSAVKDRQWFGAVLIGIQKKATPNL